MKVITLVVFCVATISATADDVPLPESRRLLLSILAQGGDPATLRLLASPVNDSWSRYSVTTGGLTRSQVQDLARLNLNLSEYAPMQSVVRHEVSQSSSHAYPQYNALQRQGFNFKQVQHALQRQGIDVNANEQHKAQQLHGIELTHAAHLQHHKVERQGHAVNVNEAQYVALHPQETYLNVNEQHNTLQRQGADVNAVQPNTQHHGVEVSHTVAHLRVNNGQRQGTDQDDNEPQHNTVQRQEIDANDALQQHHGIELTHATVQVQHSAGERQGTEVNDNEAEQDGLDQQGVEVHEEHHETVQRQGTEVDGAEHDAVQQQDVDNVNANEAYYNLLQRQGIELFQPATLNTLQRQGMDLTHGVMQFNTLHRQGTDLNVDVNDAQHNTQERQGKDSQDSAWSTVSSLSALDGGATVEELRTALAALSKGDDRPLRQILALLTGDRSAPRYRGRLTHYLRAIQAWLHPGSPPIPVHELSAAAVDVARQLRAQPISNRHTLLALALRRLSTQPALCLREARHQLAASATDALLKYHQSLANCDNPTSDDPVSPVPVVVPFSQ